MLNDWYTRKEVAELLGVSKATVYHYAKQKKIIKIDDPHRLVRVARYQKAEVDELAKERKQNQPTGMRPSELASELNVPTQRIYTLIRETDLPIDRHPVGDERMVYSIPDETAAWIRDEVRRTASPRGTRAEFYDSTHDIALYQSFVTQHEQGVRVLRNDDQAWGFYSQSQQWIPFNDAINIYKYKPVYSIHCPSKQIEGYTDFSLPKDLDESFIFLDFVYQTCGIENIRMREHDLHIDLSIKSGEMKVAHPVPDILTEDTIQKFLILGDVIINNDYWTLISGYRRTTFDLPNKILEKVQEKGKEAGLSMSEFVELAIKEKIDRDDNGK